LVNGEPASRISALDRGLQYGDGLFETISVASGKPCLWKRHIERLERGCERLGIPFPDRDLLLDEATREIASRDSAVLKITLTRGEGNRGYRPPETPQPNRIINCSLKPEYPRDAESSGVRLRLCSTRLCANQKLAGIKHLNRLEQILARMEWDDAEIVEGLMLDGDDRVIEGTMSNLFLWNNRKLQTPDLTNSGVAGVVRELVMDVASDLSIQVEVKEIRTTDLWHAEGIFITNSLIGIWPVKEIEGRPIPTDTLDAALIERVRQYAFSPDGQ
jgi:4-amino-4-deoxychorismate lyase